MNYTKEDNERCLAIANEAHSQLFWSINKPTYWSWGVSKLGYTFYEGMPTLMLRVSGAIHKGWVYVSLNEGADYYEIRLFDVSRKKCKKVVEEAYCDNIGSIIDGLVERPIGATDEEYTKLYHQDMRARGI